MEDTVERLYRLLREQRGVTMLSRHYIHSQGISEATIQKGVNEGRLSVGDGGAFASVMLLHQD